MLDVATALFLYRRYQLEIVEPLDLCPWASRARIDGRVRERVLLQDDAEDVAPSLALIDELVADPRADVAIVIFPNLLPLPLCEFDAFAARVREADTARHPLGGVPFVSAVFHPDGRADLSEENPERLIPFLRRTPHPTLQLVRASVLDRVRHGAQGTQFVDARMLDLDAFDATVVPLRERIARANLETTKRVGLAETERRLADIFRARDEANRPRDASPSHAPPEPASLPEPPPEEPEEHDDTECASVK